MGKDYIEEWKPSSRYPNYYVSSLGNIKNSANKILSLNTLVMGYPTFSPCYNGKFKKEFIHRVVAIEFCEGFLEGKQVNHKDGNKRNNRADNLEWVTHKENAIHAVKTKLKKYSNRLDDIQILTLLTVAHSSNNAKACKEFGMSSGYITCLKNGKTHRHLTEVVKEIYAT